MNKPDNTSADTIAEMLQESFARHAALVAVEMGDRQVSYQALEQLSLKIITAVDNGHQTLALGVFTGETVLTYAAFAAALLSGRSYIPLSLALPPARLISIINTLQLETVLVSSEALDVLTSVLSVIRSPLHILCSEDDLEKVREILGDYPQHRLSCVDTMPPAMGVKPVLPEQPAYVLYTSGSSGIPKPVAISGRNLLSYLESVLPMLLIKTDDRVSQVNDLSFDLSIHDMLSAWMSGACLVPVPRQYRLVPARFIIEHGLTVWLSTPYLSSVLFETTPLAPGSFRSLRLVLQAGEPFSVSLAQQWRLAAPQSRLLNLYGPSETTVAISAFEWSDATAGDQQYLPIGKVFPTHQYLLRPGPDQASNTTTAGELCLKGPQVFGGYHAFATVTGARDDWYATGDFCEELPSGDLLFLGRADQTVKIRGFRVSLLEVEAALRLTCKTENVAAIAWPPTIPAAEQIFAFVQAETPFDESATIAHLRTSLPPYMVPARIIRLTKLPVTPSGKVDRSLLIEVLGSFEPE